MAEAIGATASVITLVITAYQSCKTLYDTLSAIRNAPKHILYISSDLEDFYSVLGTIQAILDDDDSAKGILQSATLENLQKVLENSLVVFADISALIKPYSHRLKTIAASKWGRLKWTFKEKDIEDLRRTLLAHKMTLNMAISVANLYNVGAANATADRIEVEIRELQENLPNILQQLEEVKENQLPKAKNHRGLDRAAVGIDYGFTIRRFLGDAASVVASLATPTAPSLQVSAFDVSNCATTLTFRTAPESRKALSLIPERCTQLSIINMPAIETLVVQVHPEDTIGEVKGKIRQKIRLPDALFSLAYGSRVFSENDSLESCDIAHDSTFICNSFRPNTFDGDAFLKFSSQYRDTNLLHQRWSPFNHHERPT